jgi:hypothetical protein
LLFGNFLGGNLDISENNIISVETTKVLWYFSKKKKSLKEDDT